jgi:hypothetical protein
MKPESLEVSEVTAKTALETKGKQLEEPINRTCEQGCIGCDDCTDYEKHHE